MPIPTRRPAVRGRDIELPLPQGEQPDPRLRRRRSPWQTLKEGWTTLRDLQGAVKRAQKGS